MTENTTLQVVEIKLAKSDQDIAEEMAAALGLEQVALASRPEDDFAVLQIFVDTLEQAEAVKHQILAALEQWQSAGAAPWTVSQTQVEREDWAESWKQFFNTEKVSPRLVIKPSWQAYTAAADDVVVEIDPGMSFGTGQHGTTRACLKFLDQLQSQLGNVSFLDAGCGSGILAMAAHLLGYAPIYAFDYDPAAVAIAAGNLARIGADAVVVETADLAQYMPPQPCEVVAANILATVLQANMPRLLDFVAPGGYLLLSGILTEQYADIRDQVVALGAVECQCVTLQEWTSGCFCRRNCPAD